MKVPSIHFDHIFIPKKDSAAIRLGEKYIPIYTAKPDETLTVTDLRSNEEKTPDQQSINMGQTACTIFVKRCGGQIFLMTQVAVLEP